MPEFAQSGSSSHPSDAEARRNAALGLIRRFGDPVLKARAVEVDRFDGALAEQVEAMRALMADAMGVGLAAPQVGSSQRVLVYRVYEEGPTVVLVNPTVEWHSGGAESLEEGCLSLPGVTLDVERPIHVRVRARDEQGFELLVEASGLEARVIQHEIDHLDGVLILDHASKEQRREAIRTLRQLDSTEAAA